MVVGDGGDDVDEAELERFEGDVVLHVVVEGAKENAEELDQPLVAGVEETPGQADQLDAGDEVAEPAPLDG